MGDIFCSGIWWAKEGPMFMKKSLNFSLITDFSVVVESSFDLNFSCIRDELFLLIMLFKITLVKKRI